MDPAWSGSAATHRNESKSERLARLRAFTTYAEELKTKYFVLFCMRLQKQQEYIEDSRRLREEVLPTIGDDCYEDDIRYTAVVTTHNELMNKFRAILVCFVELGECLLMLCSPRLDTTSPHSSS